MDEDVIIPSIPPKIISDKYNWGKIILYIYIYIWKYIYIDTMEEKVDKYTATFTVSHRITTLLIPEEHGGGMGTF